MQFYQTQILLVDDDLDSCEMMTTFLGFSDCDVRSAQTMASGWQMAQDNYFDLCLLDSRLPDGSGHELCRRIHAISPDLPVIFYSGDAYASQRQAGLDAGAQAYLVKPTDLDQLVEIIRTVVVPQKREKYDSNDTTIRPFQTATA